MTYFAFFTRQHGLKLIQARSVKQAIAAWDTNANGLMAEWFASYCASLHSCMAQMAKLGWHGTLKDFQKLRAEAQRVVS